MDILILSHYCGTLEGKDNSRFLEIAATLSSNHDVELITTDFLHGKKKHIFAPSAEYPFKISLLHETGYPKNVCLKRLFSHWIFGKSAKRYLRGRKKPDVIYCAVPSLNAPFAAAKYCRKNGIRFVIDVQDIWPEAFKLVFKTPLLSDLIFAPMKHMADRVYATADSICAVSQTYVDRAMRVNRKGAKGHCVYLGTQLSAFDSLRAQTPKLIKPDNEIWLAYIGTLGHSYDLTGVFNALALLRKQHKNTNVRFIIMGKGPLRERFENQATKLDLPVTFTGMLPYSQMVPLLCACDIAVNPISHGAAQSIINKVGDYAAAGLPVVSTQECPEYRDLIDSFEIGINCENGDIESLAKAIALLASNKNLRQQMGENNRRLAEERFDRGRSYHVLIDTIIGASDA